MIKRNLDEIDNTIKAYDDEIEQLKKKERKTMQDLLYD